MTALRCADAADLAGDPMVGTAPPAVRWILVEHPGPWGRRALSGSGIAPDAARALGGWAETAAGRVALIRRPSPVQEPGAPRRWYVIDSRPGAESIRGGFFTDERELVDVVAGRAPGGPVEHPLYLVCAHGKHDTCCAVRGRPVAAALAAEYPERTWECTHVGGDRFAANVVVLPQGFYYGHVPPAAAVDLARSHDKGVVEPQWLRGRSSLPAAVQAAQHHARIETGDHAVAAFAPTGAESAGAGEWVVHLAAPDGDLAVRVRERTVASGRLLTCSAVVNGSYRTFDLVDLTRARAS